MYLVTIKQDGRVCRSFFAPIESDFIEDYCIYSLDKLGECVSAFKEKYFCTDEDEDTSRKFLSNELVITIKKVEAID